MRGALLFGPFRVDLAGRQLLRGDEIVPLPPKALDLLVYLAGHAGEVITREQLLDALWPGVYVDDHALSVQIREIRKALGDDVHTPQYLETRHRRGYCFKARVTKACAAASPTEEAPALPETRYANAGDVNIAYQVLGEGPVDLVFVMGWVSHLEYFWTEPRFARFLRRIASFSRLILFDKRGSGLSDRVPLDRLPTIEQRMVDLRAVMDAAGSSRAVICGVSEGGCMSAVFAATYPERTVGLIMIGTYARRLWAEDYPWAPTQQARERFLEEIRENWGRPVGLEQRAPSLANDPSFRDWWAAYLRMGASPGAALALTRMNTEVDIRGVLPLVGVPTLVLHRTEDLCVKIEEARFVASRIPYARLVELPGQDHLPFVGEQDAILTEMQGFLVHLQDRLEPTRVLATVLVAEIDRPAYDEVLTAQLRSHVHVFGATRWRFLDDGGIVAAFDGPARALRCAFAIRSTAEQLQLRMRAGLHTGECIWHGESIVGDAVEIARRILESAEPGQVIASGTLRDLAAGSGIVFQPVGRLEAEGAGEWQLLHVQHIQPAAKVSNW